MYQWDLWNIYFVEYSDSFIFPYPVRSSALSPHRQTRSRPRLEKRFVTLLSMRRTDTIRSISRGWQHVIRLSFENIYRRAVQFPRAASGFEGGHVRLIKARHRVNKRQVDAVINDHYRRNISAKEDHRWCRTSGPTRRILINSIGRGEFLGRFRDRAFNTLPASCRYTLSAFSLLIKRHVNALWIFPTY